MNPLARGIPEPLRHRVSAASSEFRKSAFWRAVLVNDRAVCRF
jgi:hypothetical protein